MADIKKQFMSGHFHILEKFSSSVSVAHLVAHWFGVLSKLGSNPSGGYIFPSLFLESMSHDCCHLSLN